jgi:ABC-type transport system substrate-binding protein
LLVPILSGCGSVGQTIQNVLPGSRGTLRVVALPPTSLDPALTHDSTSFAYENQIFSGLVRLDSKLQVQPDLAASWDVTNGGRTYTFTLRDNARFQDGRAVTAQDVKDSLERALDPATRATVASVYLGDIVGAGDRISGKATSVTGIVVKDPRHLEITIDAPKTYFLAKLTYPTGFVVDLKNVGTGPTWWQHPNGTGPFKLSSWTPQDKLVLVRNPNYYGTPPTLAEVDYMIGPISPISEFEQGNLDVAPVDVGDLPRVSDPAGPLHENLVATPLLSFWYVGFDVKQKPFDDPHVRRAFAYATDKQVMIDGLFHGTRTTATGILPAGLTGFDPTYTGIPYDPSKGRDELAQSSYKSAAALPKITLSVSPGNAQIAAGLAKMYRDNLGVNLDVVVLTDSFFGDLDQHKLQMFYLGWIADYPDAQDFADVLFNSSSGANSTRYANPEVDQILAQAQSESDPQKRATLYQTAQRLIVEDAAVIPLFDDTEYDLVRKGVSGLTVTPEGVISFEGVRVS